MNPRFLVLITLIFLSMAAKAANEGKKLGIFDGYVSPMAAISTGTYSAGDIDDGSSLGYHLGARAGFKLGPILLGGEFSKAYATRSSSKKGSMTEANKEKYSVDSNGEFTAIAANLGLMSDRWTLWLNYYPKMDLKTKYWIISSGQYAEYTYDGKAYSVELNYRIYNRLYLGLFAMQREFSKITSGGLTDADLDPKMKFVSYGLSLSYLVSWSDLASISKSFPSL